MKSKEALLGGAGSGRRIDTEHSDAKRLPIILKADVQGSLEAIEQILATIKSEEVALEIISTGVGNITESDVKIAEASGTNTLIIGFTVTPTPVASRLAESNHIEILTYNIIYKLVESLKDRLSAMLPPEIVRTDLGHLAVLAIFKTGKRDMIVGGRVNHGKIAKNALIEVKREGEIIGRGKIDVLQQNKKPTDEVGAGNECGVTFEGAPRLTVGDTLIAYTEEERKRSL